MTYRREFLKALAAAGAGAMTGATGLLAQKKNYKLEVRGGAIDVHHHHMPPAFTAGAAGRGGRNPWTPERSLEGMDELGIAVAVLSMTQQGDLLYDGTDKGRAAVRTGNEYGAKLMQQYPKRFGFYGGVPLPDLEGSLKEIEYAYDTLKADGIGVYSNDNKGRWLGDPYFEPMWRELNRRKAVVLIHPLVPGCCTNLNYGAASNMNELDFDDTRAITSLIVNGVIFRYPDVRFITVHSGGTIPVLSNRMQDRYPADPERRKYIPNGVQAELKKMYYDVAHGTFPIPFGALSKLADPSHILFGTDYSPEPIETTVNEFPHLGLSRQTMAMMCRGNAEALFPRFKA